MQHSIPRRRIVALCLFLAGAGATLVNAQPPQGGQAKEAKPEFKTIEGIVKEFTMGPDEIINGLALEDGTQVRWPKDITFRFTNIVDLGDKIKASGWLKQTGGQPSMEVATLTNSTTGKMATNDEAPPPPRDRKGGRRQP
jgi:hypothetical protein